MRRCDRCSSSLPPLARADARYCSTRCRVAAHRAAAQGVAAPAQLRDRPRWVRRSAAKVPLTVRDTPASSTNPATWATYEAAIASTAGVGVGFVLNGDGVVCVDLDDCLVGGRLAEWAQPILDRCPRTWVAVSPSGRGLHIWGLADFDGGRKVQVGGHRVEVYGNGRYITVTGDAYGSAPRVLGRLDDLLGWLLTEG